MICVLQMLVTILTSGQVQQQHIYVLAGLVQLLYTAAG